MEHEIPTLINEQNTKQAQQLSTVRAIRLYVRPPAEPRAKRGETGSALSHVSIGPAHST